MYFEEERIPSPDELWDMYENGELDEVNNEYNEWKTCGIWK